jgi:lysophospholipase L1-like esterase
MTELDPAPFLRGNPFPPCDDVPYPRAAPADRFRLPASTWQAATVPAGVRLELDGDATSVVIRYSTLTADLGYRGDGGGRRFEAWTAEDRLDAVHAVVGEGSAELRLAPRSTPVTVHLPEGMRPTIHGLRPIGGAIVPGPPRPRWVAYGDSILEGWAASAPALAWPALVARWAGLDLVNLGYAGSARGEIATAESVASLEASVISLSYGTNCWSMIPHSGAMMSAGFDGFLTIVRQGHPATPIVVVSPIRRPAAEDTPNRLGATLASLRAAIEGVVRERIAGGDPNLLLVEGNALVPDERLPDGIHPDDEGHVLLATALGPVMAGALTGAKKPA